MTPFSHVEVRVPSLALAVLIRVLVPICGHAQGVEASKALNGTFGLDPRIGLTKDAQVAAILADIDPKRLKTADSTLVSFGTRNTFSDTLSLTRGVGAARRWLYTQLGQENIECGGCMRIAFDDSLMTIGGGRGGVALRPVHIVNVVAWLPGRDSTHVVVIGSRYDSCICAVNQGNAFVNDPEAPNPKGTYDPRSLAPGADEDGSGAAAVLELARVFSKQFPKGLEHTLVFVLYDGGEQGLFGARQFANRLHERGLTVLASISDDAIGNVESEDGSIDSTSVRVFAADPDNSASRELGRYVWGLGSVYMPAFEIRPEWRENPLARTGDQTPYANLGDPALSVTERLENGNRLRLPTDDLAHVAFGYAANVTRVNAITIASLGSAPAPPIGAQSARQALGQGSGRVFNVSWCPVAGAAGYEVLARRTAAPTWEVVIPVGNTTQYLLDRQNDDEYFGVRAVGARGLKSLVASMPAPVVGRAAGGGGRQGAAGRTAGALGGANGRGRGALALDSAYARRCGGG